MKIIFTILYTFIFGVLYLNAQCNISDIGILIEENCNLNTFDVEITFTYSNTSDSFKIVGNGVNHGTFAYIDLPITLLGLPTDCNLVREFVIIDQNIPNCSDFVNAGIVCCPACEIEIVSSSISACLNDSVEITFNLDTSNVGGLGFDVFDEAGFVIYHTYDQLPVSILINAPNDVEVLMLTVCDNDDLDCCDIIEFVNPCYNSQAQCEIWDVNVMTECYNSGGFFDAEINFQYINTSDSFDILGNGNNYGRFAYNDLPVTLFAQQADCTTQYEYAIKDALEPSCTDFIDIGVMCCDACMLTNLVLTPGSCTNNSVFELGIDFDFTGTTNDFFDWEVVGVDEGYEEFENLPITLTIVNDDIEVLTVIICENDNPSCCITGTFINPCYSSSTCQLYDMTYIIECDSSTGTFDIELDFLYDNTSDSFKIVGNGVNYGNFAYSSLPVTLSNLDADCDLAYEFIAIDLDHPNCSDFVDVGEVCCSNGSTCEIWDLNVMTECYASGGFFDAEITFLYANTSDSFKIQGNGINYGTFAYVDLPVTLIELDADCDTEYEFVIIDLDNPNCGVSEDIGEVCCDACMLTNLVLTPGSCTNNSVFALGIDFDFAGTTNDFFDWEVVGVDEGYEEFENLPITLTIENDDIEVLTVIICENDNPSCCITGTFINPCYNSSTCQLYDMTYIIECDSSTGTFDIELDFLYDNTSDSFKIVGNGVNYGNFAYSSLPVTLSNLDADCDLAYEFIAIDLDHPNCSDFVDVGEVCCSNGSTCEIWDLNVMTECYASGGFFDAEITFLYANTSDSFKIQGNGINYGTFAYVDLPVTLIELDADCDTEYEFVIIDLDNPNCGVSEDIGEVCCNGTCEIWDLNITTVCDSSNNTFDVVITFQYVNTSDSFMIQGNATDYGTFAYADLPITLTGLDADCDTQYEFVITDIEISNCGVDEDLGEVCCGNGNINRIIKLDVTTNILPNGKFTISLIVEHTTTSDCLIEVYMDESFVGTISFDETEIYIGEFSCEDDRKIVLKLINPCVENEPYLFTIDLSEIDCTTSAKDLFEDVNVIYDLNEKLLRIEHNGGLNLELSVYNIQSQNILTERVYTQTFNKSFGAFSPGIYIIKVQNIGIKSGAFILKKVIVY